MVITARQADRCRGCGVPTLAGQRVEWVRGRGVRCLGGCEAPVAGALPGQRASPQTPQPDASTSRPSRAAAGHVPESHLAHVPQSGSAADWPCAGTPGGSASREFERRAAAEKEVRRRAWPLRLPIALVVVLACSPAALSVGPLALIPAVLIAALVVVAPIFGQPSSETEHYRTGARGEQRVAAILHQLVTSSRHHNHPSAVLHDRRLPGREENIDHLLVMSEGVTVIETKNWSGSFRHWQGSWFAGRNSADSAMKQDRRQAKAVRMTLRDAGLPHVPVHAVVCLAGPAQLPRPLPPSDVVVCGASRLPQQLASGPGPYDTRLLATVLDGAMPPA